MSTSLLSKIEARKSDAISSHINRYLTSLAPFVDDSAVVTVVTASENAPAAAWYDIRDGSIVLDFSQLNLSTPVETIEGRATAMYTPITDFFDDERDYRIVKGVLMHESAHSRWTNWMTTDRDPKIHTTMTLFEEARIEKFIINNVGRSAADSLRASFSHVLLPGFKAGMGTTPHVIAMNYALISGRCHAGYLDQSEIADIEAVVRTILSDEIVDQLDDIISQATVCETPRDLSHFEDLAREWNELLEEAFGPESAIPSPTAGEAQGFDDPSATPAPESSAGGGSSDRDDSDEDKSSADSDEDDSDIGEEQDDRSAVEHATQTGFGESDINDDDDSPWLQDLDAEKILESAIEALKQRTSTESLDPGAKISRAEDFAYVFTRPERRESYSWKTRAPNADERKASTLLTRLFEEMATPAIIRSRTSSELPPGRLRSREAVRRAADRASGRMSSAQPWRTEKRVHDVAPPITVGIATDTSGSMKWAEEMVASAAWIISTAGYRIGAKVAAVTFGNHAEAVVKPRELPSEISIRKANGSTEQFDYAMAALDSALHFTDTRAGRKVLIIISDNELVKHGESSRRRLWLKKLTDAGVDIIWANDWVSEGMRNSLEAQGLKRNSIIKVTPGEYEELVRAITRALNE